MFPATTATADPGYGKLTRMNGPIHLLTTGGTIACTRDADGALVPTMSARDLVAAAGMRDAEVTARDLTRLDSSSITLADLDHVLAAVREAIDHGASGVVLTHGTDSLEDTALALDLVHNSDVPVVLTGAQRAFDHPEGDGRDNLLGAAAAAADPANRGRGVLVFFGGRLLPARGLIKTHTSDLIGFTLAGDAGPRPAPVAHEGLTGLRIPILAAWPGAGAEFVDACLSPAAPADGVVVEALGSGNMGSAMGEGVARVLAAGVPTVISTRVPFGAVSLAYGGAGGGASLKARGAIGAGVLSPGQARITLATALAAGVDPAGLF